MTRTILRGAFLLCAATLFGTTVYAQAAPPEPDVPERLEEKAYVRKFSLGVSLNFTPFNLMGKQSNVEKIEAATPVEIDATADPKSNPREKDLDSLLDKVK